MKVHIVQSKQFGTIYGVFSNKELAERFLYNSEQPRISIKEYDVITPALFDDIFLLTEVHRKAREKHFKKKKEENSARAQGGKVNG